MSEAARTVPRLALKARRRRRIERELRVLHATRAHLGARAIVPDYGQTWEVTRDTVRKILA